MKVKKLVVILLIFLCAFLWFIDKQMFSTSSKPVIYMIVKVNREDFDFWNLIKMGAEAAAKETNSEFVFMGPEGENQTEEQIAMVEEAIANNPDAIILAVVDRFKLNEVSKKVVDNKIKLLTLDSDINDDVPRYFISTDNIAAGKNMGEVLISMLNSTNREIAIISTISTSTTAVEREKGFIEAINGSDDRSIDVVSTQYCDENVDKSYKLTKRLLYEHPNIGGIFGVNQQSLEGIAMAVRELGKQNEVAVVGFDSSSLIIKGLEDDIIKAIVAQKPFNMGYISFKAAIDTLIGNKIESKIFTGYEVITKETMYQVQNEKLLFPFVE